jgi:broad specificity phosphatase PhoE
MSTRLLLLRHAESADPSVFHGAESDVGLSPRGRRQAQAIVAVLAASAPVAVVSSAMRRARDTAAPIAARCAVPHHVEPALHERRVGALGGTPTGLADGPWPRTLRRWQAGDTGFATPGAESFDDMRDRVLPVWRRLAEEFDGRTAVVVAHGGVCRVLLLSLLPGLSAADWDKLGPIRNVGVSELVLEAGRWSAVRLNEVPAAVAVLDAEPD